MTIRYYTYDKNGVVSQHRFILTALIYALYQSLIRGVVSNIDRMDSEKNSIKTVLHIDRSDLWFLLGVPVRLLLYGFLGVTMIKILSVKDSNPDFLYGVIYGIALVAFMAYIPVDNKRD